MSRRPLKKIENGTIDSLAGNKDVVKRIPCLARKSSNDPDCPPCQITNRPDYKNIKKCLMSLPKAERDFLKDVLNANKLDISLPLPGGKTEHRIF